MRTVRWTAILGFLPLLYAAAPQPSDWVPVRWPWTDAKSLELLSDSPVNCLLLKTWPADLIAAATDHGLVTFAVLPPGPDVVAATRQALAAKVTGIVLEGDFPETAAAGVKEAAGSAPVIELTPRSRMMLGARRGPAAPGSVPIIGTYQGVWPGISVLDDGVKKAGPTGSTWIDTNTGFVRAVRAWGETVLWIANEPPPKTVITGARYQQVIADAAMSGARWVIALDADFATRLHSREADALSDWRRMASMVRYFEQHPEWRHMQESGNLAVVQDPRGALLSGGILDMIAVKHTPVRPIPRQQLSSEALTGATMAVNVSAEGLTPEQKEILRNFTRGGGTLLTGPPGWKDQGPAGQSITLDKAELERLNDIWRDVNSMIGRRNLGVRLFNVSSMLSNFIAVGDGKTAVLHLVNYADFPVEDIAVHFIGDYKHATLTTPEGTEKKLTIYPTEDGGGVDIEKVSVCATIKLEQ